MRVSTTDCATPGSVSSRPRVGGRGGEGRHAGRQRVGDAQGIEPPQLLADRAPDREIAGLQPRHILPCLVGAHEFRHDRVEIEGRGVDEARAGRAPGQHFGRNDRARIKADRATRDEIAPAHRDEVGGARSGADEMDRHGNPPWARAQVTRAEAMRRKQQPGIPSRRRERRGLRDGADAVERLDARRMGAHARRHGAQVVGRDGDRPQVRDARPRVVNPGSPARLSSVARPRESSAGERPAFCGGLHDAGRRFPATTRLPASRCPRRSWFHHRPIA